MKNKWSNMEKQQKSLQQKIKNTKCVAEYFSDMPEEGYMRDNISKNKVKISECKDSTLRRYEKLLTKYYHLVSKPEDKLAINNKKIEVEKELNKRANIEEPKKKRG